MRIIPACCALCSCVTDSSSVMHPPWQSCRSSRRRWQKHSSGTSRSSRCDAMDGRVRGYSVRAVSKLRKVHTTDPEQAVSDTSHVVHTTQDSPKPAASARTRRTYASKPDLPAAAARSSSSSSKGKAGRLQQDQPTAAAQPPATLPTRVKQVIWRSTTTGTHLPVPASTSSSPAACLWPSKFTNSSHTSLPLLLPHPPGSCSAGAGRDQP